MITFIRTASITPGKVAEAMQFAKKIVELLTSRHGLHIAISTQIGGDPNRIAWVLTFASLAEYEQDVAKVLSDTDYLALLASSAPLLLPGSMRDELWRSV